MLVLALSACAGSGIRTDKDGLANTSPEPVIPDVAGFETIPASLSVRDEAPGETLRDVGRELVDEAAHALEGVFSEVHPVTGGGLGDLQLVLGYEGEADNHFTGGMAKAIFSGLTMGLAAIGQANEYDYKVTLRTRLSRGGRTLATYNVIGSYHSKVAEISSMQAKVDRVPIVVQKSFEHALGLLAAKIRADRPRIMAALLEQG